MIIILLILVLFDITLGMNNYNNVLERSRLQRHYILKSNLCRLFYLLPMCEEYQNINNRYNVPKYYLDSSSKSLSRRNIHKNRWNSNQNNQKCVCKCCTCPLLPKLKLNRKYSRHTFDFNGKQTQNGNIYLQLAKKKYFDSNKRRKRLFKRFNLKESIGNVYTSVKNKIKKVGSKKEPDNNSSEYKEKCSQFLNNKNKNLMTLYQNNTVAQWNYEANLSEKNKNIFTESDTNFAKKLKQICTEIQNFDRNYNCSNVNDTIKREFKLLSQLYDSALPTKEYAELQNLIRQMESIYSTAEVNAYKDNSHKLHLEPDIMDIMAQSRNEDELKYIWNSWRNQTGRKMRKFYPRYVELINKAAKLNGFKNGADMWISVYEDKNFRKNIFIVWNQIKPLYKQLHTYVRKKLLNYYGKDVVTSNKYIPAHLLGNIFGQSWVNVYNITVPFPEHKLNDITVELQKNGYTPLEMFHTAEDFFKSLGLPPMTQQFWENSIIEPKSDVKMICHASAWDMYNEKDFRIKMCTHVTFEDFIVIHHEMGHVEYYMAYRNLPIAFREGANPGFHEAIGDTIALSVITPAHMKSLGLISEKNTDSHENNINFLFLMALQKIAFIPYALVVDTWRWGVFQKKITPKKYNEAWWNLRQKYQGVQPPNTRNEENFDPGGKFHIAAGVPYIRYFVSFVIQFQFHEALCKKAGQLKKSKLLHKCDIYKSHEAGKLLKKILSLGKSEPWPSIMYKFTQNYDINTRPLLMYFKPLYNWLKEENKNNNNKEQL